jgi:hypothetical protein
VAGRTRERADPVRDASLPECDQPLDVGGGTGGEDNADRRHETSGDAATSQDDVDERPTDPAITVDERVDGLELSVGDGGLGLRSPMAIASSMADTFAATVLALPRAARGSMSARARFSEETS